MKRLPWLLIVVMFIEIGLDLLSMTGALANAASPMLPITLFRLALAVTFTVFAFQRQPWALIAFAIMEGFTALACILVAADMLFWKPNLLTIALIFIAVGLAVGTITCAFIRTALRWRRIDRA